MFTIALKMLVGDRAKYFSILLGMTFTSFIITQQTSIFVGLMARTYGFIADTAQPDIWVMDTKVQFVDDVKPIADTQLQRVRGVEGVDWAMPLYKGILKARLENGNYQQCIVIGLDDTTLIGGPPQMIAGKLSDLRIADGIIVDEVGATKRLGRPNPTPGGPPIPLKVGDSIELNDRRAVVVGICKVSRTFNSQPVVYTTYTRATSFAPRERRLLSFVLVKARPGHDLARVIARIQEQTGLAAYTNYEFKRMTVTYFLKNTGIPINFGISVLLGFLVGVAVAGQSFYTFIVDNIKQLGALKAMGTSTSMLLGMVLLQALVMGATGYGLGVGAAAWFGNSAKNTELAFLLLWQQMALAGAAILLICCFASVLGMWKVFRLEPAIVFK